MQNAFEVSKKILTLSFHKVSPGFYPGSGYLEDVGMYTGRYHSVNVPFKDGISDSSYLKLFCGVFKPIVNSFVPDVLVVQCGGDIIVQDPVGECNVTLKTMGECLKNILELNLPTLILGGGEITQENTFCNVVFYIL